MNNFLLCIFGSVVAALNAGAFVEFLGAREFWVGFAVALTASMVFRLMHDLITARRT